MMTETIKKFDDLLNSGSEYILKTPESELSKKENPEKWSKKEILGHLIDSGIYNLQRFTEIQVAAQPYKIRAYNQDELVIANDYQNANTDEILKFWLVLNHRIKWVMKKQTDETLNYRIELYKDEFTDLRFLMTDYVDHLEHHLKQINVQP